MTDDIVWRQFKQEEYMGLLARSMDCNKFTVCAHKSFQFKPCSSLTQAAKLAIEISLMETMRRACHGGRSVRANNQGKG